MEKPLMKLTFKARRFYFVNNFLNLFVYIPSKLNLKKKEFTFNGRLMSRMFKNKD